MTVNAELQKKIEELSRLNNDLSNLLAGTGIGTVFVDHALRIRRFTPAATDIINLIQTDVGRPVAHIVSNMIGYTDLVPDVSAVLETLIPKEREVQARNGRWYLMRIQPYRTLDNVIEGAVLTFVDITAQKKMQEALNEAQRMSVESMFDPVLVLSMGGKVTDFNQDALVLFGYDTTEFKGMRIAELVQAEQYPRFRKALGEADRGASSEVELTLRDEERERDSRLRRESGESILETRALSSWSCAGLQAREDGQGAELV